MREGMSHPACARGQKAVKLARVGQQVSSMRCPGSLGSLPLCRITYCIAEVGPPRMTVIDGLLLFFSC